MDPELRTFNIEEAEALIPALTELLHQLKKSQKQAVNLEAQIDLLEIVTEKGDDKSVKELNRLIEQHHQRAAEFYAIVDKVHSYGCVLKDIDNGLVDFYTVLNGKVVYLCWKFGENKINHWHDVGKGYSARELLKNPPRGED